MGVMNAGQEASGNIRERHYGDTNSLLHTLLMCYLGHCVSCRIKTLAIGLDFLSFIATKTHNYLICVVLFWLWGFPPVIYVFDLSKG